MVLESGFRPAHIYKNPQCCFCVSVWIIGIICMVFFRLDTGIWNSRYDTQRGLEVEMEGRKLRFWSKPSFEPSFAQSSKIQKETLNHLLTSHRCYFYFVFDLMVGVKLHFQTYSYVLLGVLSVIAAFTSTALLFEKYIPQLKLLADLDNTTAYKELQKARDE